MHDIKHKVQILIFAAFLATASTAQAMIDDSIQEPPNSNSIILLVSTPLDQSLSIKQQILISQIIEEHSQLIQFRHGDVSWLPQLASQVGWPKNTLNRLGQIILRESGGCPTRTGGSIVDKNCNIIGHDGSNHRSDSGLLQINGVNWDPKRSGTQLLCSEYKICTQKQLLDPLTNLKAGYILYQKVGWAPWDPCQWGPAYASRCIEFPSMP